MMKKALITGVTGQDGSYLSKLLLEKGYAVYGVVREQNDSPLENLRYLGVINDIELVPANLRKEKSVRSIIDGIKPDEIYNLAAYSSVAKSFEMPRETIEYNLLSTLNILDSVRRHGVSVKFYQASSSEMYGNVVSLPAVEDDEMKPVSPYGLSKKICHQLTKQYRDLHGLFCCSGILFNHESVLRRRYFVAKKIVETAINIFEGSETKLRLGNIEVRRDWGYAPDYVMAIWLMLQQDTPNDYIVSTGEVHSLREFVEVVFNSLGSNWEEHVVIDENLYRKEEIEAIYGNPARARECLGWSYGRKFQDMIALLVQEERSMRLSCQR